MKTVEGKVVVLGAPADIETYDIMREYFLIGHTRPRRIMARLSAQEFNILKLNSLNETPLLTTYVGKTSMITRYVGNSFSHHASPTIGASFFTCRVNLEDARIKLQVWDTAGQERFRSMAPMYYRNANAALLVFDITQYSTFAEIKSWVKELQRNIDEALVLVLVGNKSDLYNDRTVDTEEGRKYATKIGASYHETSALHDEGIEQVFLSTALGLLRLSTGNHEMTSLRIYDSTTSSGLSSPDILQHAPSSEESFTNTSIAHGINERPPPCC